eukprot:TRINITY_DN12700_c0_g1_i1.p2 TRINITY_DN12700_c0_g1~~TRINITY_DN12700_c0_g1_i1.p2  ORF type:complete len:238 (-),score=72.54 TRINITY_DN12700_c0_g1_i1:109-732(-)
MAVAASTTAPAAPASSSQAMRCYRHIAKCALGAFALSTLFVVFGGAKQEGSSVKLMRSEPWTAADALAVKEASAAAAAARLAVRKPLMRKEKPQELKVAAAHPAAWGKMMRKEAPRNLTGVTAPRPQEWGSLMRKEAAPVVAPVVPAAAAQEEGEVVPPQAAVPTQRPIMLIIVACLALLGFALQVKGNIDRLLQATNPEQMAGKSK